ncbi:(LipO)protein [Seminavis robusta]|uniref:(LipO)protein n=1 Tax=Seminavis robusta TaxID=568900 RepID=A0A9N8EWW1_9STRA|nr:(LipO)protein [Seminavis robusta]|eukprot:Sro2573_g331690.1 (LipO)protein (301) ;mRNA; f:4657-5559
MTTTTAFTCIPSWHKRQSSMLLPCSFQLVAMLLVLLGDNVHSLRGSSSLLSSPTPSPPDDYYDTWEPRCFQTTQELRDAVNSYQGQDHLNVTLGEQYGWPIGQWCVSNIHDFSNLFQNYHHQPHHQHFNEPLDHWDMSLARDVSGMFQNCHEFNQPLDHWDLSEVTSMARMFASAKSFRQDIDMWDTSQVRDMSYMFLHAHAFSGKNLDAWDLRSLVTTEGMFRDARSIDPTKLHWDISSIPNTHRMFSETPSVSLAAANMMRQNITEPPAQSMVRKRPNHAGLRISSVVEPISSSELHP